jgi:putative sigma-54 modulation protein
VSAAKAASAAPRPERGSRAFAGTRPTAAEPRGLRIVRARRYEVKPMSVDEAALEVVDGTDAFLVFRNAATDTINVLFRRADGNLGLIEPEA